MFGDLTDAFAFIFDSDNWWGRSGLVRLTYNHLRLSLAVVVVAAALAIPPAVWLGHRRRGGLLAVSIVNIGRALPTFGIIALVLPFSLRLGFGLGYWPTFVALLLLALPPMFVNAYTGVREVAPQTVEAARGMGMREREVLWSVEVPAALPLIVTGLRVSAVQVVATATLGALVGYRCLGTVIIAGLNELRSQGPAKLLAGAILVAVISMVTELGLGRAERRLTPWNRGPRRDATTEPEFGAAVDR